MTAARFIGVLLVVAGILSLAYGGFTYTSDTHRADLGPLQMEVTEQDHVRIPVWAGIGGLLLGGGLLFYSRRR